MTIATHYKDLVSPGKADRSYLLQVNRHGQVVIYLLGPDGRPTAMAAGSVEEVMRDCLRGTYPDAEVFLEPLSAHPWASLVCRGTKRPERWREVAEILNGKASQRRAVIETALANSLFAGRFVAWQGRSKGYVVTPRGLEADAKADEAVRKVAAPAVGPPPSNGAVP